ncbi:MAG: mitochondrial ribosomal small subunit component [Bathelium mastoideum]|nr:MAG: mitochondrial ribosomal small subunit component [Bathelium mastoideum]
MGQYDFSAQRVHHAATQLLSASRLKHPPPWYNALSDIPPPQLLVRPAFRAGEHVVESRSQLPKRLKRGRRPSRMFQPLAIPRGMEHDLRQTFFSHHPWELARPRVILENDGRDAEKWDWSKGIKQPGKALDGESVVQRQKYLMQIKPPHAFAETYVKDYAECTIVVRNLSEDANANDVYTFFAECGSIQSLKLCGEEQLALESHQLSEVVTGIEPGAASTTTGKLGATTHNVSRNVENAAQQTSDQPRPSEQDRDRIAQHAEGGKETIEPGTDTPLPSNVEVVPHSIVAIIRFATIEQALAAIQKSGSSIKHSTPPILIRRLPKPPQTLFITGLPLQVTDPATLAKVFAPYGIVSHPHIVCAQCAPHGPTGFGFITLQTPTKAAVAKAKFATHAHVRLYDFPLTRERCYDLARKEFYAHRHRADVERKVAAEEARAVGAYFTVSPNDIAMQLEDQKYDDWKAWAVREVEKSKQQQVTMLGGLESDDVTLDRAEMEEGVQEVAKDVPGLRRGQAALGGATVHP